MYLCVSACARALLELKRFSPFIGRFGDSTERTKTTALAVGEQKKYEEHYIFEISNDLKKFVCNKDDDCKLKINPTSAAAVYLFRFVFRLNLIFFREMKTPVERTAELCSTV